MPPKKNTAPRFVIVATKSRPWSVVAGTVESEDGDTIVLTDARMILYWVKDVHGLYGLATRGTPAGSRVSPPVCARVSGVEHVIDATPEARAAIEAEPWT
jgi:hypothetical protein